MADTHFTIDRAELQARLREVDRQAEVRGEPGVAEAPARGQRAGELGAEVTALASGDPERAGPILRSRPVRPELVAHVVPLLESHELQAQAQIYLREQAPRIVGQLTDLLLDAQSEVLIRRRVPGVLEAAAGPRALQALIDGLDDRDFEVRLECARCAVRIIDAQRELTRPRREVHELVQKELLVGDRTWQSQGRRRTIGSDEAAILEPIDLPRIDRSLEQVFNVLALAYGREVMGSTLRAVQASDPALRGTALEYLQTTLPEKVRRPLLERIPGGGAARMTPRRSEELVDALMHSSAALPRVHSSDD
jgi:hypothetical protein